MAETDTEAAGLIALEQAPVVRPADWLLWVWRAWHRLDADRPWYGGGLGPAVPGRISWLAVKAWCRHHGYGPQQMDLLDRCLEAMDREYLAWVAARREQQS